MVALLAICHQDIQDHSNRQAVILFSEEEWLVGMVSNALKIQLWHLWVEAVSLLLVREPLGAPTN